MALARPLKRVQRSGALTSQTNHDNWAGDDGDGDGGDGVVHGDDRGVSPSCEGAPDSHASLCAKSHRYPHSHPQGIVDTALRQL